MKIMEDGTPYPYGLGPTDDGSKLLKQQLAVEWLFKKTDIIFKQLHIDRTQATLLLVDFNEAKKLEIEYREKYKYSEKDLVLAIDMARDVSDDGKDYKYSIEEILKHYE